MAQALLQIADEVAAALRERRAVVALESTIVSHGLPWPQNIETARAVEKAVRDHGALPATIAVIDGKCRVGLDDAAFEQLAKDEAVTKASSRDLAALMVRGSSAGTTVSATMRLAALAGIAVFATGGIGGVHRGAESSFDISADLIELGTTPVAVVSAGAKSILDIPKTLEVLETQRVPVITVGSEEFPTFYTRNSGIKAEQRLDTPAEIAAAVALHRTLGSGTGLLIANPIPEEDNLPPELIDGVIAEAIRQAEAKGISGKAVTPFLLDRINAASGGRSLKANTALVRNNAALAARIAVELARIDIR